MHRFRLILELHTPQVIDKLEAASQSDLGDCRLLQDLCDGRGLQRLMKFEYWIRPQIWLIEGATYVTPL